VAFNYVFLSHFSNHLSPFNNPIVVICVSVPSAWTIFSYPCVSFGLHMCVACYIVVAFCVFAVKSNKNVACHLTTRYHNIHIHKQIK
jgi:hypothetical protein